MSTKVLPWTKWHRRVGLVLLHMLAINHSVTDAQNWRISAFEKRLRVKDRRMSWLVSKGRAAVFLSYIKARTFVRSHVLSKFKEAWAMIFTNHIFLIVRVRLICQMLQLLCMIEKPCPALLTLSTINDLSVSCNLFSKAPKHKTLSRTDGLKVVVITNTFHHGRGPFWPPRDLIPYSVSEIYFRQFWSLFLIGLIGLSGANPGPKPSYVSKISVTDNDIFCTCAGTPPVKVEQPKFIVYLVATSSDEQNKVTPWIQA